MAEVDKKSIAEIMEKHGVVVGYLFGSAVRGTMGPYSDIDTAVLFDEGLVPKEKQFDARISMMGEIASACGAENADVIDLAATTDPLINYVAVFSGEMILCKNDFMRSRLECKIVRDYEDTKKLRRIAYHVMKRQLSDGTFGRALKLG